MAKRYSMGVDFGSFSARAVIFDVESGELDARCEHLYPHGIMYDRLPDSDISLPRASALRHPADFLESLEKSVKGAMAQSGLQPEQIVGLSLDFTSSTQVTLDRNYPPLLRSPIQKTTSTPMPKCRSTTLRTPRQSSSPTEPTPWGGETLTAMVAKFSPNGAFPRFWKPCAKRPAFMRRPTDSWRRGTGSPIGFTSEESMRYCSAGYKFMWTHGLGYPSGDFFAVFDERLRNIEAKLVSADCIVPLDSCRVTSARRAHGSPGWTWVPLCPNEH